MSSSTVREFLRSTSFSEDEHDQDPLEFVTNRFSKESIDGKKHRRTKRDSESQCQLRSSDTIFEHEYKYRSGMV